MLTIYNSQAKKKIPFKPMTPGVVSLYVCGITVYDYCHMGHARTTIAFDFIARYLQFQGYQLNFVRNITDVDDKIIQRAKETNQSSEAVAKTYIQAMNEDFQALNLLVPTKEPRATDYIDKMIDFIQILLDKNHAYIGEQGNVYFSVRQFKDYGALSHRSLADLKAGARVEVAEDKHDPLDFVLWKPAKPEEPAWAAPWGAGRPGWHLECSVMAMDCLGETLDLHGGGCDLKFPHHENEIAQSVCATGKPFVNTWIHIGFLEINQAKMSKSLNNFFTIRSVLEKYDGEVIRFFVINSHYRSALDYCLDNIEKAKAGLTTLYTALRGLEPEKIKSPPTHSEAEKQFCAAMNDDFNTPEALAVLFDLAHDLNRCKKSDLNQAYPLAALLRKLGGVLGLLYQPVESFFQSCVADRQTIEDLIKQRDVAREQKQWARSDQIRTQLDQMGVILEDTKGGTTWRKK